MGRGEADGPSRQADGPSPRWREAHRPSPRWREARALLCLVLAGAIEPCACRRGGAATPALGWSSWNFFGTEVDEGIILEIAERLVSTGLAALGFRYVNIDAGVYEPTRDQTTMKLVPDRRKFPRGMRFVADELHRKGLLLGLYTDLSDHTCGTGPGSLGHYEADAAQFAHEWHIDYLKVDFW